MGRLPLTFISCVISVSLISVVWYEFIYIPQEAETSKALKNAMDRVQRMMQDAHPLHVSAAASLTNALEEIGDQYRDDNPTAASIQFNFGSSSLLRHQIAQGAPADLFISADELEMDKLMVAGFSLASSRRDLLANTLVVIANQSHLPAKPIATLIDLAAVPSDKIAIGQPDSVPVGIYAKAALTKAGAWSVVQPQLVPTENVRAALAAVETGNATYGFVYRTDALASKSVEIVYTVPEGMTPPIRYPITVVIDPEAQKDTHTAEQFEDYLFSPGAQAIFQKYGFSSVDR